MNVSNLSYLVLFFSFFVFFYHLRNIAAESFDEFHYVPAAKQWLQMAPKTNMEHPPVGKYLIAASIKAFGDNAVGWRASAAVAGSMAIVLCFLISTIIFNDLILSLNVAAFSLFNFWFYVQSRIAMLDIFMVTFFLAGIYYYLKYKYQSQDKKTFYLSALFWGLSVASKWSAIYFYFPFFVFILLTEFYEKQPKKKAKKKDWKKYLWFGLFSVAIYYFTFIPYLFDSTHPDLSLFSIIFKLPLEMLQMQRSVPSAHPYQSSWYTWPLMIRPIWYSYVQGIDPNYFQGVVLLGNPLQMILGLISVLYLSIRWNKLEGIVKFTLLIFLFSWLAWGIAPRKLTFFYYFFPSAIFYSFLVPMALRHGLGIKKATQVMTIFSVLSFGFFLFFFPILSGDLTAVGGLMKWIWLKGWI